MSDARQPFRGGETCDCVATSLPMVELDMMLRGIIKSSIDIHQLGWRGDVSASAGTHDKGGCTDVAQFGAAAIDVWRIWGWTMQDRSPFFDYDHGHGWPYKCPHLAPAAEVQENAWDNRRNGLVSNGPVRGRWPVLPWKQALAKETKRMYEQLAAALAPAIGKAVVAELKKATPDLVKSALGADNIVSAGKDEPDPKNTHQAPKTFVTNDHNLLVDIREILTKLAAKP
jgi:hypothetical protein